MIIDSFLIPIATLVNIGIETSDTAQSLCDELDGRALRVNAIPLPEPILLACKDGRLELTADAEWEADVEITGTLIALNRMMFVDRQAPLREGVHINGDAHIADRFRELLLDARPDLEARLAELLGEQTAAQIAEFTRETRDWLLDVAEDLTERTADFLHEADGSFPLTRDIAGHFTAVDEFVNAVERLEARLNRLDDNDSA